MSPDDYVFPNRDGGPLNADNYLARVLIPLPQTAGIKHTNFQQLRRSVATHAQHLGSLKDLSNLLRHKQMATTEQVYTPQDSQPCRLLQCGGDLTPGTASPLANFS